MNASIHRHIKNQDGNNPHKYKMGEAFYSINVYKILIYLSIYITVTINLAAVLPLWEEKGEHERKHITEH